MLATALKAMAVMSSIMAAWLLVQAAWRHVFANNAERPPWCTGWRCAGCRGGTACDTELPELRQPDQKTSNVGGE